jgi:Rrf2 family transcriptional regulator, nitric oxide-sensitive transcriptional repressor
MQLTLHADYALRVLLYLGSHPDRVVSTQEISNGYGISKHHLVRVVHRLSEAGYVNITAGRYGGVALAHDPAQIRVGDVVRSTETNLAVVECFDMKTNTCIIAPVCHLKGVLQDALQGFLAVLDRYTLADLMGRGAAQRLALVFDRRSRHLSA